MAAAPPTPWRGPQQRRPLPAGAGRSAALSWRPLYRPLFAQHHAASVDETARPGVLAAWPKCPVPGAFVLAGKGAQMTDLKYPIEMVNGVPVVAAPEEIDASNADWLHAVLREAADGGHERFVVDMTRTRFCASAGVGSWRGRTTAPWPKAANCGWSGPPAP